MFKENGLYITYNCVFTVSKVYFKTVCQNVSELGVIQVSASQQMNYPLYWPKTKQTVIGWVHAKLFFKLRENINHIVNTLHAFTIILQ